LNTAIAYLSLLHGLVAGACLMLGATHVLLMVRSESSSQARTYLAATIMAFAACILVVIELQKVMATEVDAFLEALRREIAASGTLLTVFAIFVRRYFEHRRWRVLYVFGLSVWIGGILFTLAYFPGSFFVEVHGLVPHVTSWGETYFKPDATATTVKHVTEAGSALILAYIVMASIDTWNRGNKRSAVIIGGTSLLFMSSALILMPLDDIGKLRITMPLSLSFLGIVIALTVQLISEQVRSGRLRLEVEKLRRTSVAGEVTAGIMHELSQPLTSILSNSQAARRLLESREPDLVEVRAALDDVIAEDKRAGMIISGLRNLLRSEQVQVSAVDINDAIRRACNMLAGDLHTTGTRLTMSLHPAPLKTEAGGIQVEQVIVNLVQNALRAMKDTPRERRSIKISSGLRDGSVTVSVEDSGPGISAEIASRLFEPFASGSDGLGMGLAICKRILSAHGGRIWTEKSELGGASAVFALPWTGNRVDR
jgi:signal transduction histidine kinase